MVINVGTLLIISTQDTRELNLSSFNDGEAHLIGTCKLIVIKTLSQKNVREALRIIAKMMYNEMNGFYFGNTTKQK